MTWFAQARHVMAKDLRQARWFVIVYLGVVAMATAHALEWPGTSDGPFDLSMFFVVIVGMFLVAFLVQADSPTRSDAFWASRPFHPTAMLGAKMLLAMIVVMGPALFGQLTALTGYELTAAHLSQFLSRSARAYALWLLIAMVVAAVTSDLRGFATTLAAVAVSFGLVIMTPLVGGALGDGRAPGSGFLTTLLPVMLQVVAVGGALGVLVVLYRKRGLRRKTWVAALAAVACTFWSIFFSPSSSASSSRTLAALPTTDLAFHVEIQGQEQLPAKLTIRVERTGTPDRLLVLDSGVVILRLRDDTEVRVPLGDRRITLSRPRLPGEAGSRWLDGYSSKQPGGQSVQLSRDQREAMRAGVAQAVIEGQVVVGEPRVVARLPFRAGASRRWEGWRVQIRGVNRGIGDSLAVLSLSSISPVPAGSESTIESLAPWDTPRYALVNELRGEATILDDGRSSSSGGSLVLPGAWQTTGTAELRRRSTNSELAPDNAWLSESQLVIIDWLPRGRAPMRAAATVR